MLFFAIHNKALSDKICKKLFLVECPIESCYVLADFRLNFLAKKAPGGRSLDMLVDSGSLGAWKG